MTTDSNNQESKAGTQLDDAVKRDILYNRVFAISALVISLFTLISSWVIRSDAHATELYSKQLDIADSALQKILELRENKEDLLTAPCSDLLVYGSSGQLYRLTDTKDNSLFPKEPLIELMEKHQLALRHKDKFSQLISFSEKVDYIEGNVEQEVASCLRAYSASTSKLKDLAMSVETQLSLLGSNKSLGVNCLMSVFYHGERDLNDSISSAIEVLESIPDSPTEEEFMQYYLKSNSEMVSSTFYFANAIAISQDDFLIALVNIIDNLYTHLGLGATQSTTNSLLRIHHYNRYQPLINKSDQNNDSLQKFNEKYPDCEGI